MITLDALRTALLTPDPYDGIDRLIRTELASGRKTAAIHEELLALVKPVRATRGLTEGGEEALFGALDGLTGSCHPDSAYKDPPEPSAAPAVPSANPAGEILTPPTTPKTI